MNREIMRGEIYYADLSQNIGSEQSGVRPVLIIQNDIGNKYSPTTIAACLTSQITKKKLPTHVFISKELSKLQKSSVVLLEQVRTIDKQRLGEKIGVLSEEIMQEINYSLMVSMGLV